MFKNDFQPAFLIGMFAVGLGLALFLMFVGITIDIWDRSHMNEEAFYILGIMCGLATTLFGCGIGIVKKSRWLKNLFSWLLIFVIVLAILYVLLIAGIDFRNKRIGEIAIILGFSLIIVVLCLFVVFMLNTREVAAHFGESHLNENEQNDLLDSDFM